MVGAPDDGTVQQCPPFSTGRRESRVVTLDSIFGDEAAILKNPDFQILLLASLLPVLGASVVFRILNSLIVPLGTSSADIGLMISVFTAPGIVIIPWLVPSQTGTQGGWS